MNQDENLGYLNINSGRYMTRLSRKFLNRKQYKPADPDLITSFIPGTVLEILVKVGQHVSKGEELMILDAMKMQNKLKCLNSGTVRKIVVKKGDKVSKGSLLLEVETD